MDSSNTTSNEFNPMSIVLFVLLLLVFTLLLYKNKQGHEENSALNRSKNKIELKEFLNLRTCIDLNLQRYDEFAELFSTQLNHDPTLANEFMEKVKAIKINTQSLMNESPQVPSVLPYVNELIKAYPDIKGKEAYIGAYTYFNYMNILICT